jgi:hypothetical protein
VWSINPVLDPTGEFGSTVNQDALDNATQLIAARSVSATMLGFMSTALTITGIRAEVRDDSTDALLATSTNLKSTPLAGTGTPLRGAGDAIVVSLRTNTPGASGRGRLYWPAIGTSVSSTLRFNSGDTANLLTGIATYLHGMEDDFATSFPTIGFDLSVRSKRTHTTPHVNKLQCGNVPDSQRRRRDKSVEDYNSVAF